MNKILTFIKTLFTSKKQRIEDMFPLEAEITQEIIDTADTYNVEDCIGAKTLKAAITKIGISADISWGTTCGYILSPYQLCITTKENIDMMKVKTPQKVTFIIIN